MRERLCLGMLLLLMSGSAHSAGIVRMGDVTVQVIVAPLGSAQHGYAEYGFAIVNTGKESHTITLQIPAQNHGGDNIIRSIQRSVEVRGGDSARLSLFQPPSPFLSGAQIKVHVDGKAVGELEQPISNIRDNYGSRGGRYYGAKPIGVGGGGNALVLYGATVPEDVLTRFRQSHRVIRSRAQQQAWEAQKAQWEAREQRFDRPMDRIDRKMDEWGGKSSGDLPPGMVEQWLSFEHESVRGDKNMNNWSSNWLGYSRYDGIVLTARELRSMPESARPALWQYVEAGGSLLVIGEGPVAEGWKDVPIDKVNAKVYRPGFGLCVVASDGGKPWNADVHVLVGESWRMSAMPFRLERSANDVNRSFPVVEDIGIPVRGLFTLMIVFGILIGPVNISLLTRWKRRLWLLWTVPLLSGLTVAAVFGYMLLAEGWSRHLRTEVVTVLDENTGRASTIGWTAFYSPVTPGDGLHFDYETEATLVGDVVDDEMMHMYGARRTAVSRVCEINWNNEQHFERGWVTARVPSQFQVRKSERRRERVMVRRDKEGGYTIVNSLGSEISKFWFADADGTLHSASVVAAGAEAKLTKTDKKLADKDKAIPLRHLFTNDWVQAGDLLSNNPANYLQPQSYLAELPDAPFFEEALKKAKERKCKSVVLGLVKSIDNEN